MVSKSQKEAKGAGDLISSNCWPSLDLKLESFAASTLVEEFIEPLPRSTTPDDAAEMLRYPFLKGRCKGWCGRE